MTDFTDVERAAIARAVRCLRGYGPDEAIARSALLILEAAHHHGEDPPLFAQLSMPTWNQPSSAYAVIDRPLLDLLEVP